VLNGLADGGIIFVHLAAYYAHQYPDRLDYVDVPGAEQFGQKIAMARTIRSARPLTGEFERFFIEVARSAYPKNGFAPVDTFDYGSDLSSIGK